MKKALSLILALMLVMGIVPALAAEAPIHLTFWTFQEIHTQFLQGQLDRWNADPSKPKIEIEMQVYPYEDMHNKLTIALQTGEGVPDIVDIEINKFANYLGSDIQLAPLNEYIEPMKENLVMSRFENYAKDGNYYGIDYHIGATVMYYNTELLQQAGIDYKSIKTWDDYHAAGKKVLEVTGKPMTSFESSDCWNVYPLVNQHGGDWLTPDNEVTMDSQIVIDTLTFMKSMLEDGTAVPAPGGGHHKEEYYGWMNAGGAASVLMPFWYLGRFNNYMPDLKGKMKVAPLPTWADGGHKSAQMGGTGTAVPKKGSNVEIAKEFLAFAKLSYEGNIQLWTLLAFDPIRMDVYAAKELKETNQYFEYFGDDIFDVLSSVLDDIPNTNITNMFPAASDIVKSQMAYDLVVGMGDPAQIAKDCAEALRDLIK